MASNLFKDNLTLCSNPHDEFIEYQPHWIATLNDGSQIFQDDGREGETIPSAWLRLKKWIENSRLEGSKIWIKSLHLRFRSNILYPLPVDAEGYFFCHKLVQFVGAKDGINFFVMGTVDGNNINREIVKVPELLQLGKDIKPLDEKYQEFVILRS